MSAIYVIGVPMVVEIADDGTVTFEVDLSEVEDIMDVEDGDHTEAERLVHSDAAQRAAERINNTHRFTA